jgi:aldehyde dehydrogenase (NAD+)
MQDCTNFYIDGSWHSPQNAETMDVINPATEEACARISLGTVDDVDRAALAASRAFASYGISSRDERIEVFESLLATYKKRYDDIADAITMEMGAPTTLAMKAQAAAGVAHLQAAMNLLKNFEFEEDADGYQLRKEPIGVCGLITPWNWPLNQIGAKLAPALATGCTVILKPSEIAPLSAYVLAEIIDEAGVPGGVFNLVNGDGPGVGTALSSHPLVDMVSFTGSSRAGSLVAQNAAPTIKRVTQELGGKSANIILDDADLDAAVGHGAMFVFMNTGQSCNAPTRMLVPEAQLDRAAEVAAATAAGVKIGDPRDEATTMGPVVSAAQFDKIQALIQLGIDEGATLVCGGTGKPEGLERGYFVKPTVFSNVDNQMTIAREEIFGPVLSIIPYKTDKEAIEIANDSPYGLAGYVSGKDPERLAHIASRVRAGNIYVNGDMGAGAPFGGYKQSGNGREKGVHGFQEYLEIKAVCGLG